MLFLMMDQYMLIKACFDYFEKGITDTTKWSLYASKMRECIRSMRCNALINTKLPSKL
jgi:hypothetical protein